MFEKGDRVISAPQNPVAPRCSMTQTDGVEQDAHGGTSRRAGSVHKKR